MAADISSMVGRVRLFAVIVALSTAACSGQSSADQSTDPEVAAAQAAADKAVEEAAKAADAAVDAAKASDAAAAQTPWTYRETSDEMRGTKTRFASVPSENSLVFGFPYDGGQALLTLRQRPQDGLNIFIDVSGQFICNDYSGDTVAVKFDDGPVQKYTCAEPDSGGTGTLFINNEARFLTNLRKAKKVIIEATFYEAGRHQMTFNVAGLEWK